MGPYKIEFSASAAASAQYLPAQRRARVMSYLLGVALEAGLRDQCGFPVQRTAEVASLFVRYEVDGAVRCVRVISPLE